MIKGILTGVATGVVVSGLGVMAIDRFLPRVDLQLPMPEAGEVAVPAGSEFNTERPDAPPILPGTQAPPESGAVPVVAAPGPEIDALPDTTPLDTPETAVLAQSAMTPPPEAPTPLIVSGDVVDGPMQSDLSQPDAPRVDPAVVPELAAEVPVTGDAPTVPVDPVAVVDPVVEPAEVAALPQPGTVPDAPSRSVIGSDVPPVSVPEAPRIEPAVVPGTTGEVSQTGTTPVTSPDPVAVVDPAVETQEVAVAEAPPVLVANSDGPSVFVPDAPLGLPVSQIEDMAPGVTTDRLPRIGAEALDPAKPLGLAMQRNAIPFENTAASPMIAIILVDVGAVRPDVSVLAEFPVPLTVAIDPTAPDATALMQAYRAAGLEIAILAPLPEGASPADVEVAFQSFVAALPEAVVVMDVPEAILQENRPRAAQVVAILAETGHGLVTYDRGLNPAVQIASQSDVPAAKVFRDIDPGAHDVAAMKRFLDQAAFRAGLEGNVILKAEARPETLTALAEWTLGSRAASVTFAPVSAVLKP